MSTRLLGVGSVAVGVWGLIDPLGLAALMGDDPRLARPLSARDAAIGVALLAWPDSAAPLVARMASDASDAVRLARRRRPFVVAVALGAVAWSALTLIARGSRIENG